MHHFISCLVFSVWIMAFVTDVMCHIYMLLEGNNASWPYTSQESLNHSTVKLYTASNLFSWRWVIPEVHFALGSLFSDLFVISAKPQLKLSSTWLINQQWVALANDTVCVKADVAWSLRIQTSEDVVCENQCPWSVWKLASSAQCCCPSSLLCWAVTARGPK